MSIRHIFSAIVVLLILASSQAVRAQGALEYFQYGTVQELEKQFCVRKHSTLAEWRFLDFIGRLRGNTELVSKLKQLCEEKRAAKEITVMAHSDFEIIVDIRMVFIDVDASIEDISEFLLTNARKSLK